MVEIESKFNHIPGFYLNLCFTDIYGSSGSRLTTYIKKNDHTRMNDVILTSADITNATALNTPQTEIRKLSMEQNSILYTNSYKNKINCDQQK